MSQSSGTSNNKNYKFPNTVATTKQQKEHVPPKESIAIGELSLDDIKTFDNGVRSTNMLEAKVIAGKEREYTFKILEIMIHDQMTTENIVSYTIGQYEIFYDAHVPWGNYNVNTLYYVRKGDPTFWIADEGKTIRSGSYICVPEKIRHTIYNHSKNVNAVVDMIFPGKIIPPTFKK